VLFRTSTLSTLLNTPNRPRKTFEDSEIIERRSILLLRRDLTTPGAANNQQRDQRTYLSGRDLFEKMTPIPVIDISPFVSGKGTEVDRNAVARAWDAAFSASGFAIIVLHGIPGRVFETLDREARRFFARTMEEKMEHCHGAYGNDAGGYTPPGVEAVGRSKANTEAKADPVQNFAFRGLPSTYKGKDGKPSVPFPSASSYVDQMEGLLSILHRITARSLNLPTDTFFERFYAGGSGKNGNALRIAHYPSPTELKGRTDLAETRYNSHTDYQTFTILRPDPLDWAGSRGGLEVFLETTKEWVPVVLPKNADCPLVVNAGDLWEVWTDDRWHSGLHRVTGAGARLDGSAAETNSLNADSIPARQSLVYFTGPLDEALIEPLPGVGKGTRKAVTAGDHLRMKLGITNVPAGKL